MDEGVDSVGDAQVFLALDVDIRHRQVARDK